MHSILLQATLRISYTSYIRQYIRRCSGSIGLGHCCGHCSTWPGLFFLGVMVILSSLGLHHAHHRRSPHWKSHQHHLRHYLSGKHRRHHPQHAVGRSITNLLVDPVHHRHAADCTPSEHYYLLQQTSEKTNDYRVIQSQVIATLITAMHACHRMFLHFLHFARFLETCFEIFWDTVFRGFLRFFEPLHLSILLLPLLLTYPSRFFERFRDVLRYSEIFWDTSSFFFCCFSFVFCICLNGFFYQLQFFFALLLAHSHVGIHLHWPSFLFPSICPCAEVLLTQRHSGEFTTDHPWFLTSHSDM